MSTNKEDETKLVAECIAHSKDLLQGAEKVIDQHPYIAYHLTALALEEIGKGHVLKMRSFARSEGRDENSFSKKILDDHTKKLFWALWGNSFGREMITGPQIEEYKGLASHIHNKRVETLYVPLDAKNYYNPREIISREEALAFLNLVKSRILTERADEELNLSPENLSKIVWFEKICQTDDNRIFVWSVGSMRQLADFKSVHKWIDWLQAEFEKVEKENRELFSKEMARQRPSKEEENQPKWKMSISIQCESHSLRKKAITFWNQSFPNIFKFSYDEKKKSTLYVEFMMPKRIPAHAVYDAGLRWSQRMILSLNIGTFGLFWWYIPKNRAKYYETLEDVDEKRSLEILREPPLKIEWGHRAISNEDIMRVAACFAFLPPEDSVAEWQPFTFYIQALTLLSKSDIHMLFTPTVFDRFLTCLILLAERYGERDSSETRPSFLSRMFAEYIPEFDEIERFKEITSLLDENKPILFDKVTLEDISKLKLLIDFYILKKYKDKLHHFQIEDEEPLLT